MAEYIDWEALIEWLKRIPLIDLSDGRGLCRVIMEDDFKKAIKKMPKCIIAEVAPVRHGQWVEHKHFNHDHYIDSTYECSECNVEEPLTSDYCPNCGAKMGGGADNG